MDSYLWTLLLQFLLIALNAIFASAETAIIGMNDNRIAKLAEEGDKRAIKLAKLTEKPSKFLATIQVAITLAGFLGSAFAADTYSGVLGAWLFSIGIPLSEAVLEKIALILITLLLSYLTIVLGELVPKRIAMKNAEKHALKMAGFISNISVLFKPLV
ncbi:MAG: DUF21 domain-containing protein, partial [Clostridia bacterium]|nr:DUF21 domain-containing protein [Clostridia bacterium]